MKKELPSKFRFTVGTTAYYLAEMSTQADAYNISLTDSEGKDVRNLNHKVLKERTEEYVNSGYWKVIEEPFELPNKFTFTLGSVNYTGTKQEDNSFIISWDKSDFYSQGSYPYTYENVMSLVKNKSWKISELIDVAPEKKIESTLLDDIEEFVNKTNSQVHFQSAGSFYIQSGFLGTDFTADNKEELKQLIDALTVLWNIVNGKK